MENNYNNLLFGIALVIMGIFYFLERYFEFPLNFIGWIFFGAAFLLLYKTKQRVWALLPALYLIYWGFLNLLVSFGADRIVLISGMFFIVPGTLFVIMYLKNKKNYMIYTASLLICFGIGWILKRLVFNSVRVFVFLFGFSFIFNFYITGGKKFKKLFYLGIILMAAALRNYIELVLIGAGIMIMMRYLIFERKKKKIFDNE